MCSIECHSIYISYTIGRRRWLVKSLRIKFRDPIRPSIRQVCLPSATANGWSYRHAPVAQRSTRGGDCPLFGLLLSLPLPPDAQ